MSDTFYSWVVFLGQHAFRVTGDSVVLHADRIPRHGPFILASTHTSAYDVPVLMRASRRRLDFVSITELFRNRKVAWFFSNMNAFPLERNRADPATVRIILDRLERGRAVAMFPEGGIRSERESIVHGTKFRPGVARIARLAGVKIIPVVVWGTRQYEQLKSWLPIGQTRYGINFGKPMAIGDEAEGERMLAMAYRSLYGELRRAMDG
ncbi:MAG: lysophospholipid acyltransferase family protein [Tepidisphaeraceae bacterium]